MSDQKTRANILRNISVLGASTIASMIIGLARSKIVAVTLGPAGVGLIGIFNSLMITATNLGTLGIGVSGVRHIAKEAESEDPRAVGNAYREIFVGLFLLAIVAAIAMWLFSTHLATIVVGDPKQATNIALLGVGVALGIWGTAQNVTLSGLRKIGDVAKTSLFTAIATTLIGIPVILWWGEKAIVPYMLVSPIALFIFGLWYVRRLGLQTDRGGQSFTRDLKQCLHLSRLGIAFLVTLFLMSGGLLALRAQVLSTLGVQAVGLFEASWTLINAYSGALLVSLQSDFYPRVVSKLDDPAGANVLLNEQTRLVLLIAGPLCVGVIAVAPFALQLLFSSKFVAAAPVLRLLVIGDIFKLMSWPLGFLLTARGDVKRMIMGESLMVATLLSIGWIGLSRIGLIAASVGYIVMYILFAVAVTWWLRRTTGFRWQADVLRQAATVLACGALTIGVSYYSQWLALAVGVALSAILAIGALKEVDDILAGEGRLGGLVSRLRSFLPGALA